MPAPLASATVAPRSRGRGRLRSPLSTRVAGRPPGRGVSAGPWWALPSQGVGGRGGGVSAWTRRDGGRRLRAVAVPVTRAPDLAAAARDTETLQLCVHAGSFALRARNAAARRPLKEGGSCKPPALRAARAARPRAAVSALGACGGPPGRGPRLLRGAPGGCSLAVAVGGGGTDGDFSPAPSCAREGSSDVVLAQPPYFTGKNPWPAGGLATLRLNVAAWGAMWGSVWGPGCRPAAEPHGLGPTCSPAWAPPPFAQCDPVYGNCW